MPYKKLEWSANRPIKPDVDPLYVQLMAALKLDTASRKAAKKPFRFHQANNSGLSPSTLRNWEMNKVRHPQGTSMQMAARMLGMEMKLVPLKRKQKA